MSLVSDRRDRQIEAVQRLLDAGHTVEQIEQAANRLADLGAYQQELERARYTEVLRVVGLHSCGALSYPHACERLDELGVESHRWPTVLGVSQ